MTITEQAVTVVETEPKKRGRPPKEFTPMLEVKL
jgi:hypothetical protein